MPHQIWGRCFYLDEALKPIFCRLVLYHHLCFLFPPQEPHRSLSSPKLNLPIVFAQELICLVYAPWLHKTQTDFVTHILALLLDKLQIQS